MKNSHNKFENWYAFVECLGKIMSGIIHGLINFLVSRGAGIITKPEIANLQGQFGIAEANRVNKRIDWCNTIYGRSLEFKYTPCTSSLIQ